MNGYPVKAGIEWADHVGPHTPDHTFATELLRRTGNLRLVQKNWEASIRHGGGDPNSFAVDGVVREEKVDVTWFLGDLEKQEGETLSDQVAMKSGVTLR